MIPSVTFAVAFAGHMANGSPLGVLFALTGLSFSLTLELFL